MNRKFLFGVLSLIIGCSSFSSSASHSYPEQMGDMLRTGIKMHKSLEKCEREESFTQSVNGQIATYSMAPIANNECKYAVIFPNKNKMECNFNQAQRYAVAKEGLANNQYYLDMLLTEGSIQFNPDDSPKLRELIESSICKTIEANDQSSEK